MNRQFNNTSADNDDDDARATIIIDKAPIVISSFAEAKQSGLISDVLFKVISREGKSKNYTDVIPLDGGTVGIAHFAVGGLSDLYDEMDTDKYFGKTKKEMKDNFSSQCRPAGKKGNDTGWGCYSKQWWKDGMVKFGNSEESKQVQDTAWSNKMEPVITQAIGHGWKSRREIAIALGIANSVGAGGFAELAKKNDWDAEATLSGYVGNNDHRKRRAAAINNHFAK